MSFLAALFLLTAVTSITCALPGVFLVLRRQSMLVDAISHAVLPGIVIGVFLSGSLHSPVMIIFSTLMGLLVVWVSNRLRASGLLTGDADQGVLFPVLFSLGVLLLSTVFASVHICTDTVLAGDLNLMALRSEHIIIGNINLGPKTMWELLVVFVINALFIGIYYRTLKTSTFDRQHALSINMPVTAVENMLMVLTTITIIVAFSVAGSILVVALVICPAATALLISHTLPDMIIKTLLIAVVSAVAGCVLAWQLNLGTSSMMAFTDGVIFLLVMLAKRFYLHCRHLQVP